MYICGQKKIIERIDNLVERNTLPRFIILVSPEGFGKKVISEYISKKINAHFVPCKCDVDSIREAIANAYSVVEKTLYMIFDCDGMSTIAKNALLKVTEEPPNSAYFIMTFRDAANALGTITSRGTLFYLNNYSEDELNEYSDHMKYSFDKSVKDIVSQICVCPKDIQIANEIDIKSMYEMADKFIQFVGQANIANELKLTSQMSTKKDDEKLDPTLFLRCVMTCCYNYIKNVNCPVEDVVIFDKIIKQTSRHLKDLSSKSCNKQMTLDNYIINTHLAVNGGEL
jgi:replication-associated recombination protein RarA